MKPNAAGTATTVNGRQDAAGAVEPWCENQSHHPGDVLRFLGHKTQANGRVHGNQAGEVLSRLNQRPEGRRLDRARAGRPHQFRVYRASERDPDGKKRWPVLRKGVGDLHRRAEICEAANGRYLEALASVHGGTSAGEVAQRVCQPIVKEGRRRRGLNPWAEGEKLMALAA